MSADSLIQYIQNLSYLQKLDYQDLVSLVNQYPYCNNLRYLLVQKGKQTHASIPEKDLQLAATYSIDRSYLYHAISISIPPTESPNIEQPEEATLELAALADLEKVIDTQGIQAVFVQPELETAAEVSSMATLSILGVGQYEDPEELDLSALDISVPEPSNEVAIPDSELIPDEAIMHFDEMPEATSDGIDESISDPEWVQAESILSPIEEPIELAESQPEIVVEAVIEEEVIAEIPIETAAQVDDSTPAIDEIEALFETNEIEVVALPQEEIPVIIASPEVAQVDFEIINTTKAAISEVLFETNQSVAKESFSSFLKKFVKTEELLFGNSVQQAQPTIERAPVVMPMPSIAAEEITDDDYDDDEEDDDDVILPDANSSAKERKSYKEVAHIAEQSIAYSDDLVSETFALIHIKQERYQQAIEMFERLSLQNPEKSSYFAAQIAEVQKLKDL